MLDKQSSSVRFEVGSIKGRFNAVDAQLTFFEVAEMSLQGAKLEVTIATGSIDLTNPFLESMLRGEAWFDSATHPLANFSSQAQREHRGGIEVSGDLSIKGITQTIKLRVHFADAVDELFQAERIHFTAEGNFSRTAFGMSALPKLAPDLIDLHIDGTFVLNL